MEHHHAIHGKTHELSMAMFNSYVAVITRGYHFERVPNIEMFLHIKMIFFFEWGFLAALR